MTDHPAPLGAKQKIAETVQAFGRPPSSAGELELTLSTLVTMGEDRIRRVLAEVEDRRVDEMIRELCVWMAAHRSDGANRLLCVELPLGELSTHDEILTAIAAAELAAEHPVNPLL